MLAGALLAGSAAVSIGGIASFARSVERVSHSHQVLQALEGTRSHLLAAESAARMFRLTERPEQHADMLLAAVPARRHAETLLTLTADNPAQQRRARQLRALVDARLEEANALLQVQLQEGAERARTLSLGNRGPALMRQVEAVIEQMIDVETELLRERHARSAQRERQLKLFVILSIVLPTLMLIGLLANLAAEARRARRHERDARHAMSALESTLEERDRLSEQRNSLGIFAGLLQSCQSLDEALKLTGNLLSRLFPETGGRCYVLRASQNLAESADTFGKPVVSSSDVLHPAQCWGLRRGKSHHAEPGQDALRCTHASHEEHPDAWTLCIPLVAQGVSLGLLHLSGHAGALRENDRDAIATIAEQLGLAMANLQLRETLRIQSLRDPLTGLYNRRYLEENLSRELHRCGRRQLPLSVMMLDVDHFKRFNDTHGHAAGDALLARVGELLQGMTRGEDIACRYGGEEFTVVLPEAPREVALRRAEAIREAVHKLTVVHLRQPLGAVTISIGVATFPQHGESPERLLAAADGALYRAKAEGRDRVAEAASHG